MNVIEIGGGLSPSFLASVSLDPLHPLPDRPAYRRKAQDTPWPFEDGVADIVYASHVLEHIPAGDDRIAVFNEAHRVLKRDGFFDIVLPLVGYTQDGESHLVNGWQPYADPTHVSFWWFPESLLYFCEGDFKPLADYGIKTWRLDSWGVRNGFEGWARLVKVDGNDSFI